MTTAFAGAVLDADGRPFDRIRLTGLSATGHHGVLEHERADGQLFRADVVLHLDTREAARGDDLADTVSYAGVAEDVVSVLAGSPADLIETVAERIAATILVHPDVVAVDVAVHKPQAPLTVPFDDVEVVIRRDRVVAPVVAPLARRHDGSAEPRTVAPIPVGSVAPALIHGVEAPPVMPPSIPPTSAATGAHEVPGTRLPDDGDAPASPDGHAEVADDQGAAHGHDADPRTGREAAADRPSGPLPAGAVPSGAHPSSAPTGPVPTGPLPTDRSLPVPVPVPVPAPGPAGTGPVAHEPAAAGTDAAGTGGEQPGRSAAGPDGPHEAPGPDASDGPQAPGGAVAPGAPAEEQGGSVPGHGTDRDATDAPAPGRPRDRMDEVPADFVDVVLALGANLGDPQQTLREAITDLDRIPGVEITDVSPLARTAALGPEQPDYLNTVLLARTRLSARDLLHACHAVEHAHGRVRDERWGPRTLDIDLVVYGSLTDVADDLELPHPRAHERAFVLEPWSQVDPDAVLPGLGGGPVAALAATAPDRAGIRWLALDWLTEPAPNPTGAVPVASAAAGGSRSTG
ncbi:2-amino-4-hydroxy-6-hydroxymethyldihydropteridine diphosphokinase [Cellulosimicrobium sp. CUA-896]|uniref:2-amino-4-hydroxy-6- hydroxymethyldihydropteridine diphosphokinase n=1 Tax=Cellulosimicrobium sp. CUA-896 TaxID=1517881 RepID=UPI00096A7B61|nr:2-amino-4-hydroxy-6-hydroxymethyldihydropteridine diphosphokinase [Cellulosimicrobium sp. CUA-896]